MSLSTVDIIIGRIESATKESPIAVFKLKIETPLKLLDAVFGSTVKTQQSIKNKDPLLIGLFDRSMNKDSVRFILNKASR